jgi:plastocyanin
MRRGTCAAVVLACAAAQPASAGAAEVVAGPGQQFLTPSVEIAQGERVTLANRDATAHDVTARGKGADGKPLFASALVPAGGQGPVEGTQYLVTGDYPFLCSIHPDMTGSLRVTSAGTPEPRPGAGPGTGGADTAAPGLTVAGKGRLSVAVQSDEAATVSVAAKRGRLVVARGRSTLAAGQKRTVKLRLTRAGRSRLRKTRRLRVTFAVQGRDAAGNVGSATARGVLRR